MESMVLITLIIAVICLLVLIIINVRVSKIEAMLIAHIQVSEQSHSNIVETVSSIESAVEAIKHKFVPPIYSVLKEQWERDKFGP